ncbi:MAG: MerR family transcriptional regulator [Clostridia bacterium]|nr:MerR family transcriptional regulator [Clostridia bacterium]
MQYLRKQIAKAANINVETLRYYERNGLITVPERNEKGYRLYDDNTLKKLAFIKTAKSCGLTLGEIKDVFSYLEAKSMDYSYIKGFVTNKLEEIERKMEELDGMRKILTRIRINIDNQDECPVKSMFKDC